MSNVTRFCPKSQVLRRRNCSTSGNPETIQWLAPYAICPCTGATVISQNLRDLIHRLAQSIAYTSMKFIGEWRHGQADPRIDSTHLLKSPFDRYRVSLEKQCLVQCGHLAVKLFGTIAITGYGSRTH